LRLLSTEAPSLHRHYPASSVLRASPPPQTARPVSHELPVDPQLRSPLGLPVLRLVPFVCMPSPIPRQDRWARSLVLSHRLRPSLDSPRVGSCITRFEACSAFTLVTACILAKSPIATLYTRGFSSFVASTTAPIATGWSEPVPGWDFHPL
jgi:hypothetical protein